MINFILVSRPIVSSLQTENMGFPLAQLPIELALDILCLATSPVEQADQPSESPYSTGCALALVSHCVRQVIMPHFLHTIILNSHESLNKFVRTLQQQKECARNGSRLTLDYPRLVRHVWTSRYWEPIIHQNFATSMDFFHSYDLLGDIFCTADSLGFTFQSHPLLYEVLGLSSPSPRKWSCKRVTFAGNNARWNPLISTANGQAFLQQLTHLTIWLPADDSIGTPFASHLDLGLRVPNWVQRVPFEYMNNLKYFAFSLVSTPRMTTTPVVVYTIPPPAQRQQPCDPTIFRTWASSSDPLAHGKIINVGITHSPEVDDSNWSLAFLRGENDMRPVDQDMEQ